MTDLRDSYARQLDALLVRHQSSYDSSLERERIEEEAGLENALRDMQQNCDTLDRMPPKPLTRV